MALLVLLALLACRGIIGIEERPLLSDAGAPDGGSPDAAEELPNVSEFCAGLSPPPGFCDDFDVLPFEGKWDNALAKPDPGVGGGGTVVPDTVQFLSAPRSARMQTPPLITGGGNALAMLITSAPKALATLELYAAIRIDTEFFPDDLGHTGLLGVSFANGNTVELRRYRGGTFLYTAEKIAASLQPVPVGVWRSLEMRFVFDTSGGPNGIVRTYVDGAPGGSALLPADFYRADAFPRVFFGLGIVVGPIGEVRLNVDNVALRGTLK